MRVRSYKQIYSLKHSDWLFEIFPPIIVLKTNEEKFYAGVPDPINMFSG